ncbi:MAG: ATP-binding protein, partial [Pyrinomonadaceae bacterium]
MPKKNSYVIGRDIYYPGILKDVRKSSEPFRPVFEVFINSLEAIRVRPDKNTKGRVDVRIKTNPDLIGHAFHSIEITDNGVGFDSENFERFLTFKDNRKGPGNKGSGRMQLAHFFGEVDYISTFRDGDKFSTIAFSVSKDGAIQKNALVFFKDLSPAITGALSTSVELKGITPTHKNDYAQLSAEELKQRLLSHFWLYFALNKNDFPEVNIQKYEDGNVIETEVISEADIPKIDKDETVDVHYSGRSADRLSIEKKTEMETFSIKCFRMPKDKLSKNAIKLTSKNEIVENVKVQLASLTPEDEINGNRYLFLVSGDYIDSKESETRGELAIPTKANFLDSDGLFETDEILLDDIQSGVNGKVLEIYSEIRKRLEEKESNIEELRETYILDPNAIEKAHIGINDSDEKILAKVYSAESESTARKDAYIKEKIDAVKALNTTDEDYPEDLSRLVGELVNTIPDANRLSLTHYVARRRIVLELFSTILGRELDVQKTAARSIDEKLLHNLIFQQTSTSAESSDLWLINEDFIYFSGNSEIALNQ